MEKNKIEINLYLSIIIVCSLLTTIIISYCYKKNPFFSYLVMIIGIILVITIDGITAAICRLLPLKCADFNKNVYKVSKKEKKLYDAIKIKKWKERIPEIGHFTGFRKNEVKEPNNIEYIKRFLNEICYGELGHFISCFTGFILLFIPWFNPIWFSMSIVICLVNAILNILPIFVLRYNSYTLLMIYNRLSKKSAK